MRTKFKDSPLDNTYIHPLMLLDHNTHPHAAAAAATHVPLHDSDQADADLCKASYSLSDTHFENSTSAFTDYLHTHPHAPSVDYMNPIRSTKDFVYLQDTRDPHHCVLTVRGTQLEHGTNTAVRDVFNDLQISAGMNPHRGETVMQDFVQMQHQHPECTWHLTGHSLGGRIVNDIASHHPEVTATSFEAPGNADNHFDNITSHKILGDPIAFGYDSSATVLHTNPVNDWSSHSIFNF